MWRPVFLHKVSSRAARPGAEGEGGSNSRRCSKRGVQSGWGCQGLREKRR